MAEAEDSKDFVRSVGAEVNSLRIVQFVVKPWLTLPTV